MMISKFCKKMRHKKAVFAVMSMASLCLLASGSAKAQRYTATPETDAAQTRPGPVMPKQQPKQAPNPKLVPTIKDVARDIVQNCNGGNWETQPCLSNLGTLSFLTTTTYADTLQKANTSEAVLETLKQECAASTAPMQGEYPAYAVTSAMTVCANKIYDISEQTNQKPDPDLYQLMVASIMCLNKQSNCTAIEQQLAFGVR